MLPRCHPKRVDPSHQELADDGWIFGLEQIPAAARDEEGNRRPVASSFHRTVIRPPKGTPQALTWAAEEIVWQCGPDWSVGAVLLQWLRIEAGEEDSLGFESCVLERVSPDQVRVHSHYSQWEDLAVPIADVRRMLIDMMHFLTRESQHPLPSWRIKYLSRRDWAQERAEGTGR